MDQSSKIRRFISKKYLIIGGTVALAIVLFLYWPLPKQVPNKSFSTVLLDEEEELLGAILAEDEIWRFPASDSLPYRYKTALLQYEDAYYYQHPGINPMAILKALFANMKAGKVVRGGSTISMQLARLAYGNSPRTVFQKLKEIFLALRLEAQLSKEEILLRYATHAPFGSNIEGISAASYRYFGRAPHALSWGEAALLAVLPNQPSMIYPGRNSSRLIQKRNGLLEKLLQQELIDSISYQLAVLESIPIQQLSFPKNTQHLLYQLDQKKKGKTYYSTLNGSLQNRLGDMVNQYVKKLELNEVHNASALVIDWQTEKVKAYIGNANSGAQHDDRVDIIRSVRSPGSLLKPFLYGFSLHAGLISPEQFLIDIPLFYEGFTPKNFDHKYYGAVHANDALARSLNIPFVNLLRQFGVAPFYDELQKMGYQSLNQPPAHYGLSLILGGAEISPWEIGKLYTHLVRSIAHDSSHTDLQIEKGEERNQKAHQLRPGAAYQTVKAMKELQRPGEEFGWERFGSSEEIAWKTGTSFGFRDAWAVGINQRYVVVIWTGNADGEGRPGLIGVRTAAPLLFQILELLEDEREDFSMPDQDLKIASICEETGYIAATNCPHQKQKYINKSLRLQPKCPYHKKIFLDKSNTYRVNANCYPLFKANEKKVLQLPPAVAYYYQSYHADFEPIPGWLPACESIDDSPMEIIYPKELTSIFIPKELDGKEGRAIFELAHQKQDTEVFWYVDGSYLGSTRESHQIAIGALKAGEHQLYVVDADANYLDLEFKILARE